MDENTKTRIGLLLQSAIQDAGPEVTEAVFAFRNREDGTIALVPVERYGEPLVEHLMKEEGVDRFSAVEAAMGKEGFVLLGLLAVRVTDEREALIEYEEVPGRSVQHIKAAKQVFWEHLVSKGKITPKRTAAEA